MPLRKFLELHNGDGTTSIRYNNWSNSAKTTISDDEVDDYIVIGSGYFPDGSIEADILFSPHTKGELPYE